MESHRRPTYLKRAKFACDHGAGYARAFGFKGKRPYTVANQSDGLPWLRSLDCIVSNANSVEQLKSYSVIEANGIRTGRRLGMGIMIQTADTNGYRGGSPLWAV